MKGSLADIRFVDSIVDIMADVLRDNLRVTYKGKEIPHADAVAVYRRITYSHVNRVLENFRKQQHTIIRSKNYVATMLHNVVSELEPGEVNDSAWFDY